jgi:formate hydrogenlyase subunit 3/multisubunit Na+/H+ antiporter MnhD subunit
MSGLSQLAQAFGPGLLAATLATPLMVLAVFLSRRLSDLARALAPFAPLPALGAAILAIGGAPFAFELPALRMNLSLDQPGAMLLAAAALVWTAGSVFARADMTAGANAGRFAVTWLLTMAGSLGVFIAADLLTFYLVYALVSVPAYCLVAADEDAASSRAGAVYMAFTLLGEAVLLIAFVMLAAGEPGGSLDVRAVVAALPGSSSRDAALALLTIGFGMKIALVPLNGWMPLA